MPRTDSRFCASWVRRRQPQHCSRQADRRAAGIGEVLGSGARLEVRPDRSHHRRARPHWLATLMDWDLWSVEAGIVIVVAGAAAALRAVTDELARVRMLMAIAPDLSREALTEVTRWMAMSPKQNRPHGRIAVSQPSTLGRLGDRAPSEPQSSSAHRAGPRHLETSLTRI
jgi:hypothetical protein